MTYHPHAVNAVGMGAWISGTAASLGSSLLVAADPAPLGGSPGGQAVATGGVAVALIGLLVQVVNKVFDDRKQDRDERRAIREHEADLARHDTEIVTVRQSLDQTKADLAQSRKDLDDSREKRHREASEWNIKLLELQLQVRQNTDALNTNGPTIRRAADKLGLRDNPVAGPVPHVVAKSPLEGPIAMEPHADESMEGVADVG